MAVSRENPAVLPDIENQSPGAYPSCLANYDCELNSVDGSMSEIALKRVK